MLGGIAAGGNLLELCSHRLDKKKQHLFCESQGIRPFIGYCSHFQIESSHVGGSFPIMMIMISRDFFTFLLL